MFKETLTDKTGKLQVKAKMERECGDLGFSRERVGQRG